MKRGKSIWEYYEYSEYLLYKYSSFFLFYKGEIERHVLMLIFNEEQ